MSYGRQHQQGTEGELYRAIVSRPRRPWNRELRAYVEDGTTETAVYGPYTTRGAAKNAAAQSYWPTPAPETVTVEKLTHAVWTPVTKSGNVDITPERYEELLAAERLLVAFVAGAEE